MTARKKPLRAVADGERVTDPDLLEAIESGDVLAILKAQRRIIAQSLVTAAENTKPQFSNELTKLTDKITAEEAARRLASTERESSATAERTRDGWDQSAI